MTKKKIQAKISGAECETAYITLPAHPCETQTGCVARTIRLDDVIADFKGPRIHLDFNKEGVLIGIEILA